MERPERAEDTGRRDWFAVTDDAEIAFVSRLAEAAHRHRFYPATSSMCVQSSAACCEALHELPMGSIVLGVGSGVLAVDDREIRGNAMVQELAEQLFRADLEQLSVRSDVEASELSRFLEFLPSWEREQIRDRTLDEALIDLGIMNIHVSLVTRARVMHSDEILPEQQVLLEDERRRWRSETRGGRTQRGWVHVDTACTLGDVGLVDLAFLFEGPHQLACLVEEALEGEVDRDRAEELLVEHLGELIELYDRLSDDAAEQRFRLLVAELLALQTPSIGELVETKLLPELIDAGRSAPLLRRFPDDVLVVGLSALVARAVGGARLVHQAIRALELPAPRERELLEALRPALESADSGSAEVQGGTPGIALHHDGSMAESLAAYRSFDLVVDDEAQAALDRISSTSTSYDASDRLDCIGHLLFLGRNPARNRELLESAEPLLRDLMTMRKTVASRRIRHWLWIAESMREARPDLAESIETLMTRLCTPEWLREQAVELASDSELAELLAAFGGSVVASYVQALVEEEGRRKRRALLDYMCEHAGELSSPLRPYLEDDHWTTQRNAALVIGFGGPGAERYLSPLLKHEDGRIVREAMHALARIGSPESADVLVRAACSQHPATATLAEEAVCRLPGELSRACARRLLAEPSFYGRYPRLARNLLNRVSAADPTSAEVVASLTSLRYRFWRPEVASLGRAARRLLAGGYR